MCCPQQAQRKPDLSIPANCDESAKEEGKRFVDQVGVTCFLQESLLLLVGISDY